MAITLIVLSRGVLSVTACCGDHERRRKDKIALKSLAPSELLITGQLLNPGWLPLEYHGRSAYSLPFEIDHHFDTVSDLNQRNALIHPVILTVESHCPLNL